MSRDKRRPKTRWSGGRPEWSLLREMQRSVGLRSRSRRVREVLGSHTATCVDFQEWLE